MSDITMPKIDNLDHLCDVLQLCSIRKNQQDETLVVIKPLDWVAYELLANDIIWLDSYMWKPIKRVYSSGHVFLDALWEQVFLVEVEKSGVHHFQFTWWSPKEKENERAYYMVDRVLKFDLWVMQSNAYMRTKNRTSVEVKSVNNLAPCVDRVLIEKYDEETNKWYWNLVCLIHFLVKEYDGELQSQIWTESVIWWEWIPIDQLDNRDDIAPNVPTVIEYFISKNLSKG